MDPRAWVLSEVLAARPSIRVDQLGALPGQPVRATAVRAETEAVPFSVDSPSGVEVRRGTSTPWGSAPEATSGMRVHVLDAGPLPVGDGYRFRIGTDRSHPFRVGADLHRALRDDALRFFTRMRSGWADERPAGHLGVPPNRGDLAVRAWSGPDAAALYPGWRCDGVFDVSGGWYDAGDYGKYTTSGAIAVWQLLGVLDVVPGADEGFRAALVDECRWQLDWLLRMQVPAPDPLAGMAFHRVHGTAWPPLPCPPERDPTERVLHRPSTEATLQLAAVAAQAARLLRRVDAAWAARSLAAACTAWRAAAAHPDLHAPDDHARFGGGPYGDDRADDDRYWAAAELWLATGSAEYAGALRASPAAALPTGTTGFDFDDVVLPARLDLARSGTGGEREAAVDRVVAAADALVALQRSQAWGQPYAPPSGWAWGSNGRLLNNLVVLAVAERLTGEPGYLEAVATGIGHLLGRNALGQSYVTGHGTDASRFPRTRRFGVWPGADLPPVPPGAVVGGANSIPSPDFPYDERLLGLPAQCCYLDETTSEVTNDVCIRWNAPLVLVAAHLDAAGGGR